jgi:hypothetical protein
LRLAIIPIFVIANYPFSLPVIAVRQTSQGNGKSLKTGILYVLGFTSELFSQLSLRFAGWVYPMNAA